MCRSYRPTKACTSSTASAAATPARHLLEHAAQSAPTLFEHTVIGHQRGAQFAQAHRVRTGHGLEQCREEIELFILVVMSRGGVEIAHHRDGGLARLRVGTMRGQVRHQAKQRLALALHTQVTGREHLQRDLEAGAGRAVAGKGVAHGGPDCISRAVQPPWLAAAWTWVSARQSLPPACVPRRQPTSGRRSSARPRSCRPASHHPTP